MSLMGVHHVAFDVDDLDAADRFYVEVLGCSISDARPDFGGMPGRWYDVPGGGQIHVVVQDDLATPSAANHVALRVDDIEATVASIRALGVQVGDPFDLGAGIQTFLHDPAGNLIELNQPT